MNKMLNEVLQKGLESDIQYIDKKLIPDQIVSYLQAAMEVDLLQEYVRLASDDMIENRDVILADLELRIKEELFGEMDYLLDKYSDDNQTASASSIFIGRVTYLSEFEKMLELKEQQLKVREQVVNSQLETLQRQLEVNVERLGRKIVIDDGLEDNLGMLTKECPECGVTFEVTHPNKIYCSAKCSKKASNRRWRERSS